MKLIRLLTFAAICFGLSACAPTIPPLPTSANVDIPEQWRIKIATGEATDTKWWLGFDDPMLNILVDQARANNTDIAIAIQRVREARAQIGAARSVLLPTIEASGGLAQQRALSPFGTTSESLAVQPQFQAAYEIDLFGRINNQIEAAQADALATEMAESSTRLAVTSSTTNGYVTLIALDGRRTVLEKTLASRTEALRIARSRARVGYTSQLELRQAESEYQATAAQIPNIDLAIVRAENALSLLTGTPPRAIERRGIVDMTLPVAPGSLPSQIVAGRPDIIKAAYTLAAADSSLAVAQKQFLPQIRLAASIGAIFSSQLDNSVSVWSLGGSVLAPIFNGGRLESNFEAADARRVQAAIGYRRAVLTAFREVEDQLSSIEQFELQRDRLIDQRKAVADALRHATNRYRAGYSPYIEQLDAQRSLLQIELALVQNRNDRLASVIALYQATGGGELVESTAGP